MSADCTRVCAHALHDALRSRLRRPRDDRRQLDLPRNDEKEETERMYE